VVFAIAPSLSNKARLDVLRSRESCSFDQMHWELVYIVSGDSQCIRKRRFSVHPDAVKARILAARPVQALKIPCPTENASGFPWRPHFPA
jgi:hypothetical protein